MLHGYVNIFWQMQGVCTFPPYWLISECVFKYMVIFHAWIRYTKWSEIAPGKTCVSSIAARELSSATTPEEEAGGWEGWRAWWRSGEWKSPLQVPREDLPQWQSLPWGTPLRHHPRCQGAQHQSLQVLQIRSATGGVYRALAEKYILLDLYGSGQKHFSRNAKMPYKQN